MRTLWVILWVLILMRSLLLLLLLLQLLPLSNKPRRPLQLHR